jgi:uncharacterized protein (DUF849 family)
MGKVIISCAVTGSIHTPTMSPHLPVTPAGIAESALEATEAGAAIVHLHARNPEDGRPDQSPEAFEPFLKVIRVNCGAPGAIETEGWNVYTPEARVAYPRSNPMMRAGSPWDVAEACAYLAGPSGGFVTGETLTVDGGGQLWGETWTTGKPPYFTDEDS